MSTRLRNAVKRSVLGIGLGVSGFEPRRLTFRAVIDSFSSVALPRSGMGVLFAAGFLFFLVLTSNAAGQDKLSAAEAKKLKSPVPYTSKSIAQGRGIFARYCTGCHGADGKSAVDVVADATDLTDPANYRDGNSEGEMFRSIRDGAGASMPAFKTQLHQEIDIWHLVNYIRSLWPDAAQPHLQDSDKDPDPKSK